jgi:hypothetical protein
MLPKIRRLTALEVALLFGVTCRTVDWWVRTGDPTTVRIILGEVGR